MSVGRQPGKPGSSEKKTYANILIWTDVWISCAIKATLADRLVDCLQICSRRRCTSRRAARCDSTVAWRHRSRVLPRSWSTSVASACGAGRQVKCCVAGSSCLLMATEWRRLRSTPRRGWATPATSTAHSSPETQRSTRTRHTSTYSVGTQSQRHQSSLQSARRTPGT